MKTAYILPVSLCALLLAARAHAAAPDDRSAFSTNHWQTKSVASEADLDRLVSQLQIPAKRFDAMLALLEFAGWPKGNVHNPDPKVNALHKKAIDAIQACPGLEAVIDTMIAGLDDPKQRLPMIAALLQFNGGFTRHMGSSIVFVYGVSEEVMDLMEKAGQVANAAFDPPTVQKALDDPDPLLRLTAVREFAISRQVTNFYKLSDAEINQWKPLLPQMEKLAAGDDQSIRYAAVDSLLRMPGTESFLAARETNETSAGVLMILISRRHGGAEAYQQRFLALFLPLLTNPDESVRTEALMFIGANSNSAPMYHIPFGMDVFDRVIASAKAQSAGERFAAVFALVEVRNLDPDRARETFLNLVNDPDDDVRWRIAYGLADQLEREDVQKAIATLLQDKSPLVRYFTILVAGAAKHIPELEALSKGPNAEVADWAAQQLTQLAHPQGSPRTPNEP